MIGINEEKLILEKDVFDRFQIEKRMLEYGVSSISKFELFIWDLEIFQQFQKKLGERIVLKGGAATQFYIPITSQRTSIDIDMICIASREELHEAISQIETELNGTGEYCKFRAYKPKNPKLGLDMLETYYVKVPSICDEKELFTSHGLQEVKIEFLFSNNSYPINKISRPILFSLDTKREFNILALDYLLADKLTTLGPSTIGIPCGRADEQFKQLYDVITLFLSNVERIIANKEKIRKFYCEAAMLECEIHSISYEPDFLFSDMKMLSNQLKGIENNSSMLQLANDFQALYLRRNVSRGKAQWAIVGYQLGLLIENIFKNDTKILDFRNIEEILKKLEFKNIHGIERGRMSIDVRNALESDFRTLEGLSSNLFRKRFDRIIWELVSIVTFEEIEGSLRDVLYRI